MTERTELFRRVWWVTAVIAAVALASLSDAGVAAQEGSCGVGTRIQLEGGSDAVGTIEEIGTQPPHVGWFRISFSWSPQGEWYPADYSRLLIAGTKTRCSQVSGRGGRAAQTGGNAPRPETTAGTPAPAGCPFSEPPGRVTKSSPPSAGLFKRVIYEKAAAKINPDSITAPKKVGLTFLEFNMGEPYKNTLTSSRFGDKRRHDGAPVGAMIYPVKTKELQCDLHGREVRRRVTEVSHDCFKNRDGEWTCPGRTTKVVESILIPLD